MLHTKVYHLKFFRDTISECRSDFLQKSYTSVYILWILCSSDLHGHRPSCFLCEFAHAQNALLIPLFSEQIRVNIFSIAICKRASSQHREQKCF